MHFWAKIWLQSQIWLFRGFLVPTHFEEPVGWGNWNSYRVDPTNDTKGGVGVFFLPLGKLFPWSLLSSFVTSIFSFLIRFFAISWITKMESMQLHVTRVWFIPIRNIVCIDFLNLQLRDWDYSLFGIETAVLERFFVAQPLCLSSCSKSKY